MTSPAALCLLFVRICLSISFYLSFASLLCPLTLCVSQDGAGRTVLHWAAHMGLADVCRSLAAAAGSDLFFVLDATGATPLQYAVNAQKIDVLQAFLDMPDVIDVPDAYGRTGLMVAIAVNNQQMFDMIVDSKKVRRTRNCSSHLDI